MLAHTMRTHTSALTHKSTHKSTRTHTSILKAKSKDSSYLMCPFKKGMTLPFIMKIKRLISMKSFCPFILSTLGVSICFISISICIYVLIAKVNLIPNGAHSHDVEWRSLIKGNPLCSQPGGWDLDRLNRFGPNQQCTPWFMKVQAVTLVSHQKPFFGCPTQEIQPLLFFSGKVESLRKPKDQKAHQVWRPSTGLQIHVVWLI